MNLLGPKFKGTVQIPVQQQKNGSDCGVFHIAFAICLVYGGSPCNIIFDFPKMCLHLLRCLHSLTLEFFEIFQFNNDNIKLS